MGQETQPSPTHLLTQAHYPINGTDDFMCNTGGVMPDSAYGFIQVLFMGAVYGYILFNASNMISEGSELLLLVPSLKNLVGSIVLPILGAIPDGAIVLFSGLGDNAQEELGVGIGALAGSTIMLLTLPWAGSIYAGRVGIDAATGRCRYRRPKLTPPDQLSLTETGVEAHYETVRAGGIAMALTAASFVIIQAPAFAFSGGLKPATQADYDEQSEQERGFALAGLIVCSLSFLGYLVYQARQGADEDKVERVKQKAIENQDISLSGAFIELSQALKAEDGLGVIGEDNDDGLLGNAVSKADEQFTRLVARFFMKYDVDRDGSIDRNEMSNLLVDFGDPKVGEELDAFVNEMDSNGDGRILFDELLLGLRRHIVAKASMASGTVYSRRRRASQASHDAPVSIQHRQRQQSVVLESLDEEGEDEEVPEDLASLSPDEQQSRIKQRAAYFMAVGTAIVLLFSDPMVSVLSSIGARTGIPAFYISFVLAPLASNASELIASLNYSAKKTKQTITISMSTLLGAACMNNTFCLAIFLVIIYLKGLVWEFSAETLAILFAGAFSLSFSLPPSPLLSTSSSLSSFSLLLAPFLAPSLRPYCLVRT